MVGLGGQIRKVVRLEQENSLDEGLHIILLCKGNGLVVLQQPQNSVGGGAHGSSVDNGWVLLADGKSKVNQVDTGKVRHHHVLGANIAVEVAGVMDKLEGFDELIYVGPAEVPCRGEERAEHHNSRGGVR